MTDAQLGKWLAAFRVGALEPILERFESGDVIDALVALLREAQDAQTIIGYRKLQARLRAVLGEKP